MHNPHKTTRSTPDFNRLSRLFALHVLTWSAVGICTPSTLLRSLLVMSSILETDSISTTHLPTVVLSNQHFPCISASSHSLVILPILFLQVVSVCLFVTWSSYSLLVWYRFQKFLCFTLIHEFEDIFSGAYIRGICCILRLV